MVLLAVLWTELAQGAPLGRAQPGDPLPDLELTDLNGVQVDLASPDDQVHLLLFLRHLHKYEQLATQDLRKITDDLDDQNFKVHAVWVALEKDAPTPELELGGAAWLDPQRKAVEALGIIVYPTTLLISKDRKILERVPSHPPSYALLIESAVRQELGLINAQEFQHLRGQKDVVEKSNNSSSRARLLASFAEKLARGGKLEQAGAEFKKAMQLAGDDPQVGQPYAAFLLETDQVAEARSLVDRLLEHSPSHSGLQVLRARLLARDGQHEEAAGILEAVLPLTPDKAPVLFELGKVRAAQEQWQAAAELYGRALQLLLDER